MVKDFKRQSRLALLGSRLGRFRSRWNTEVGDSPARLITWISTFQGVGLRPRLTWAGAAVWRSQGAIVGGDRSPRPQGRPCDQKSKWSSCQSCTALGKPRLRPRSRVHRHLRLTRSVSPRSTRLSRAQPPAPGQTHKTTSSWIR